MTQAINIYWQKLTDLKCAFNKLFNSNQPCLVGEASTKRIFKEILQAKQAGVTTK